MDGITYWVVENPAEIFNFANTNLRQEWEADARSEGRRPEDDDWLNELPNRKWNLETVQVSRVRLNPKVMEYVDKKQGSRFADSLAKRVDAVRKQIETYATVIWPTVVRGEDMMVFDGYCRFSTLKTMNVPETFSYAGRHYENRISSRNLAFEK